MSREQRAEGRPAASAHQKLAIGGVAEPMLALSRAPVYGMRGRDAQQRLAGSALAVARARATPQHSALSYT